MPSDPIVPPNDSDDNPGRTHYYGDDCDPPHEPPPGWRVVGTGILRERTEPMNDIVEIVERLRRYATARNRLADREPRTIEMTDDEALSLVLYFDEIANPGRTHYYGDGCDPPHTE